VGASILTTLGYWERIDMRFGGGGACATRRTVVARVGDRERGRTPASGDPTLFPPGDPRKQRVVLDNAANVSAVGNAGGRAFSPHCPERDCGDARPSHALSSSGWNRAAFVQKN
jgi:hypothetical protein